MTKQTNDNLIKLTTILNDGEYHDGNTIGEKLQMTRAAVWKSMKKLENYGIKIDSIKGKGYALLEPLILLDQKKIKKNLTNDKVEIIILNTVKSTNDYLKVAANKKAIKFCLAEQQTHGKGRLNRKWYSPFGKNIYLSCFYPFQKDISELAGLSLVCGLSMMKTLQEFGLNRDLYVKWPNDIIYQDKKLAGVLIEIQAETHGMSHAIIGIGVNVNMLNDQHHIQTGWTSLQKITGNYVDRNILSAKMINYLVDYLAHFNLHGFKPFVDNWIKQDYLFNQTITVNNMGDKIHGRVTGINIQGHLLLQLTDGTIRAFSSGDTSIVKKE